jgi:hypothetical protein
LATEGKFVAALAIGQEPELADTLEAAWQDVQEETADELVSRESHGPLLITTDIVFPAKSNVAVLKCEQAVVGDGHPVSVAAQISQDLFWSTEGRLGIDPPLTRTKTPEQTLESWWLGQVGAVAMKGEFAILESFGQRGEKESAK